MKYKQYRIVSAPLRRDLEVVVNLWISEGWQPIGGLAADEFSYWYQAMGLPE